MRAGSTRSTGAISSYRGDLRRRAGRHRDDRGGAVASRATRIEEIVEPYLIQQGFIQRTPRGRMLTAHAFRHLGLAEPARDPSQFGLFGPSEEE